MTRVEVAIVLLILIPLVTLGSKYYMSRVQDERNMFAIGWPGLRYRVDCTPSKDEYIAGEDITFTIRITNIAAYTLDMLWPDGHFMLTTDPNAPANPGYPVPPASITGAGTNVAKGIVRTKSGRPRGSPEFGTFIRLKSGESLEYDAQFGPARAAGFQGKILITTEAGGIPSNLYDIRDPNQTFLRDGRFLVSNEIRYKVTEPN